MSHDIVADALNNVMNAKRARKNLVVVNHSSKVLFGVLEIARDEGYIENFKIDKNDVEISFGKNLNMCKAIKPRHNVSIKRIEFYVRRYLPARNLGVVIVSTNKGLMTHQKAEEKKLGGTLIAYFY
ncbi:MAG: 30S ribosomal protein S8 [Nanoarchaeota archaeon]|nr:30S ribosomal protein S8 [Nanoarchaeota archaeon]